MFIKLLPTEYKSLSYNQMVARFLAQPHVSSPFPYIQNQGQRPINYRHGRFDIGMARNMKLFQTLPFTIGLSKPIITHSTFLKLYGTVGRIT